MSSLQEQLLKAGLTTKDKVVKARSEKRKQDKITRKHKLDSVDENKLAAQKALEDNAQKARELNELKNQVAQEKALVAQVKQLIETNLQSPGKSEVSFNFSDQGKIKKLQVSKLIHKHLTNGLLAIVKHQSDYGLVPKVIAEKVQQRLPQYLVTLNTKIDIPEEDDPYADYQIPDDLMW